MDEEDRYTRITLRIPRELHGLLSEAAEHTSKSLNAEIIGRLTSSFESHMREVAASPERIDALELRLERQSKAAHLRVLLMGLETQMRDAAHRVARQQKEIARLERHAEETDDAKNPKIADAIWREHEEEVKWLAELEAEYKSLSVEHKRLQKEVVNLENF